MPFSNSKTHSGMCFARPSARPSRSYVESVGHGSPCLTGGLGLLLREAEGNSVAGDPLIWTIESLFSERSPGISIRGLSVILASSQLDSHMPDESPRTKGIGGRDLFPTTSSHFVAVPTPHSSLQLTKRVVLTPFLAHLRSSLVPRLPLRWLVGSSNTSPSRSYVESVFSDSSGGSEGRGFAAVLYCKKLKVI